MDLKRNESLRRECLLIFLDEIGGRHAIHPRLNAVAGSANLKVVPLTQVTLFLSSLVVFKIVQPTTRANPFALLVFAATFEVKAAGPRAIGFRIDLDLVAVHALRVFVALLIFFRSAVAANLHA